MNQQQNERIQKTQLTPERIDDDALNRAYWVAELYKVVASPSGIAAVVGEDHCLVHGLEHHLWYHYRLSNNVRSWVLTRDGARLWGLVGDKLVTLDLRSGEWTQFQHHPNYQSILYAEGDAVVAKYRDIATVDVLRLENDSLRRITNVPVKPGVVSGVITSEFWPEKGQFIVLDGGFYNRRAILRSLNWNGGSGVVLDITGIGDVPSLCLPFVAMRDEKRQKLIYADLRENPVKPRHVDLGLKPEWGKVLFLNWFEAFAFDNSLIVALTMSHKGYDNDRRFALIRLREGEEFDVLYECRPYEQKVFFHPFARFAFRLLGRFLTLGGEWVYDLATRQEVRNMPWSALLHQAIQDETKQQQVVRTTAMPMLTQAQESSDIDAFKVFLDTSPFGISELVEQVANQESLSERAISSSRHSSLFVRHITPTTDFLPQARRSLAVRLAIRHTTPMPTVMPTMHLLSKGTDQLKCLLPEPKHGWERATFDEQERVWACDTFGQHVVVVDPDKQEGRGLIASSDFSSEVEAIAVHDNNLAMASRDELAVYRYEDGLLKERLFWKSKNRSEILGIKPDTKKRGLWVVTRHYSSPSCELWYLPLNEKISAPEKVGQVNHRIHTLGDWPEKVYFVYTDDIERTLHYTSDPREGWRKVSLQSVVRERDDLIAPASLSSNDGSMFTLLNTRDATLLVRLHTDKAELISAFKGRPKFARWGDWLVLYSKRPLAFAQDYADRAKVTALPENKRTLFFHLDRNQIYEKPIVPYAVTDMLHKFSTGLRRIWTAYRRY